MPEVRWIRSLAAICAAIGCWNAEGCKPKVSDSQCARLLDRYAQLVVGETLGDASPERMIQEQAREKKEARAEDVFKNCSTEVSLAEFECAMRATTPSALQKCLE